MKRMTFTFAVLLVAGIAVCAAVAQPPGGPRGPGDQPGGRGFGGPDGFRPPVHPLEQALDTDGDRQLSAEEIEHAVTALKKLDKNKDGKLSDDELRPQFGGRPGGDDGRGRGFGTPDGRGAADRPDGRRPFPDGPPRDGEGRRPGGDEDGLARILSYDKNEDGKLSKDELPERMQGMLRSADKNGDGMLDRDELSQMIASFRERAGSFREQGDRRPEESDRPEGRNPEGRGYRGSDARPGDRGGPPSPEVIVENAMRFDADNDGKLSRDELLEFAREMARFRGGPGGPRDRGDDGGRRGEGRPQRPDVE